MKELYYIEQEIHKKTMAYRRAKGARTKRMER
jgi:hypothetical protein